MADLNNGFTDITENFDTIKTLLNSIRAQGILNTSDVDKLLSGINSKLEKLNTNEDIDLIKIYMNDLKENLEERHSVLLSKFGAMESLFSNILQNTSDSIKTNEIKELFDIVATNLAVFSREVVFQKGTLNDIDVKLNALHDDDSQKQEIIKNISLLKGGLDGINNEFNSVASSLNENFKVITDKIVDMSRSSAPEQFGKVLGDITNSSDIILAALNMLNEKHAQLENRIQSLATQNDINNTNDRLNDLAAQNMGLAASVSGIAEKYDKIDNLAGKIDASVSIIAGLKASFADQSSQNGDVLAKLEDLENSLKQISENKDFDEFKVSLENFLRDIFGGSVNFQDIYTNLYKTENGIREAIDSATDKIFQLAEAGTAKTLSGISSNTDILAEKLKEAHSELGAVCEKNFSGIIDMISDLKSAAAQLDENNISSNNAMLSSITDRLALFESGLKTALEKQEYRLSETSNQLSEQMENIKNLSGALDYKMETSVNEFNGTRKEFVDLRTSFESIFAPDFINTVQNLKSDLSAVKHELVSVSSNLRDGNSDNQILSDMLQKYEQILNKLDGTEIELKQVQASSLNAINTALSGISSSVEEVFSYIKNRDIQKSETLNGVFSRNVEIINEAGLNYAEKMKEFADDIRKQIEEVSNQTQLTASEQTGRIEEISARNTEIVREDIRNSDGKLSEIRESVDEIRNTLNADNSSLNANISLLMASSDSLRNDIDTKLSAFKNELAEQNIKSSENVKNELSSEIIDNIAKRIEDSLIQTGTNEAERAEAVKEAVIRNTNDLKEEIQNSHDKLCEIQDGVNEVKEALSASNTSLETNVNVLLSSSASIRNDINSRLSEIKNDFLDKLDEYKQGISTENAENTNSLKSGLQDEIIECIGLRIEDKFNALRAEGAEQLENIHSVVSQNTSDIKECISASQGKMRELGEDIKNSITQSTESVKEDVQNSYGKLCEIEGNFDEIKETLNSDHTALSNDINLILSSSDSLRENIDLTISSLKEDIIAQNAQNSTDLKNELCGKITTGVESQLESGFIRMQEESADKFGAVHSVVSQNTSDIKECISASQDKMRELGEDIKNSITQSTESVKEDVQNSYGRLQEIEENFDEIKETLAVNSASLNSNIDNLLSSTDGLKDDIASKLNVLKDSILEKIAEYKSETGAKNVRTSEDIKNELRDEITQSLEELKTNIKILTEQLLSEQETQKETPASSLQLTAALAQVLENFTSLRTLAENINERGAENLKGFIGSLTENFAELENNIGLINCNMREDLTKQAQIIENFVETLTSSVSEALIQNDETISSKINTGFADISEQIGQAVISRQEQYKVFQSVQDSLDEIGSLLQSNIGEQNKELQTKLEEQLSNFRNILETEIKVSAVDYNAFTESIGGLISNIEHKNESLTEDIQTHLAETVQSINSGFNIKSQELNGRFDEISLGIDKFSAVLAEVQNNVKSKIEEVNAMFEYIKNSINSSSAVNTSCIMNRLEDILKELADKADKLLPSVADAYTLGENNTRSLLDCKTEEIKTLIADVLNSPQDEISSQIKVIADELCNTQTYINNQTAVLREIISDKGIYGKIRELLKEQSENLNNRIYGALEQKINLLLASDTEISAGELQTFEALTSKLASKMEAEKNAVIEDFSGQLVSMKNLQKDELTQFVSHIEETVDEYIRNNLEDLKSYLDVKTGSSVLNDKLDMLRTELSTSAAKTLDGINSKPDMSVFSSSLDAFRAENETLLTSLAENLNKQISDFIKEEILDNFVKKCEEIKLIEEEHNCSLSAVNVSVSDLVSQFSDAKEEIYESIDNVDLSLADLKVQILNKTSDEELRASINSQVSEIEKLINEQFGYLEDISELCANNFPELTEMNTIVKYGIQKSITDLISRFEEQSTVTEDELNKFKTEILTQFINVFNQISFAEEQEEILDFIREKHAELITILSRIVPATENIETVKDNLTVVDNKIDNLKDDISHINERIAALISSNGDEDYVYSLQDVETDIAKLHLVLNDVKENVKSKDLDKLIELIEDVKAEMPKTELEEFQRKFNTLSEDIISISTRTNKLLLASDESYQTLKENLHEFKLVINDLDERTRNFSHEAGIDKIDNKLQVINSLIQNGAKSNLVFNQVFEYLAEWVDKADVQINSISDKIETLDDIKQIKVMLEDLKNEAADNSENSELIEALSNVFDKQAKRISSLEAKLDRLIVAAAINDKENKIDISPFEDTLNRFLAAIDDRMHSQQEKINSLETKLGEVMSLIDPKDTAQLTKKVGGMDRQIAKLNKSIEKIASHVVEK